MKPTACLAVLPPKVKRGYFFPLLLAVSIFFPRQQVPAFTGQDTVRASGDQSLNVFLDVNRRDENYIKTEIPYISYVRDQVQADLFLMITSQQTGSSGTSYSVYFLGRRRFASLTDTLQYNSRKTDTEETTRAGLVKVIKMGLVRFMARTPMADQISVYFKRQAAAVEIKDSWDHWVFGINLTGNLNGEQSRYSREIEGGLSADRVTEDWKLSFFYRPEYNFNDYVYTDGSKYSSERERHRFRGNMVRSINNHWSAGLNIGADADTYSNIRFLWYAAPAIEYNIFPYSESTRKEFRIVYRINFSDVNYQEVTIYDKTAEKLMSQSLSGTLQLKQTWGSVFASLSGSHYFHDFDKNYLRFSSRIYIRIYEGLSFNLRGDVSMIHNQLSLAKGGATDEEILLHRKQVATTYNYRLSAGLSYSFGSIFSNIVNPRFGN